VINIILFASDLDNTLIHSYKKADTSDICVEKKEGKELSYMTPYALQLLREVNNSDNILFSPVTTRSLEQYLRIDFFNNVPPKMALAANGGILIQNGEIDSIWFEESKKLMQDCYEEFRKGISFFQHDEYIYFDIRVVDELFVFTKSSAPLTTRSILDDILDLNKVKTYNIGDKVYIFPNILTKGTALQRLKQRFDFEKIICAGDSEFDVPMLNIADTALCPDELKKEVSSSQAVSFDTAKRNFAEQILEYVQSSAN